MYFIKLLVALFCPGMHEAHAFSSQYLSTQAVIWSILFSGILGFWHRIESKQLLKKNECRCSFIEISGRKIFSEEVSIHYCGTQEGHI